MSQPLSPPEAAEELLKRRRARTDGAAYREYVSGLYVARHSRLIWDKLNELKPGCGKHLMFFLPPGSAKPLALDTPIATTCGWKTMGTLDVGDYVFDENGKPTLVTWKSPVMKNREVFCVSTHDGERIYATGDHPWSVMLCRKHKKVAPKETQWLYERQLRGCRPAAIVTAKALLRNKYKYTIDPYVLGVWLGDGSSTAPHVTTEDQFILDELERLEGGVKFHNSVSTGKAATYRIGPSIQGEKAYPPRTFTGRLRVLGIYGDKHIPERYMMGSYEQRLALLQGLMDTDGTVDPKSGMCVFSNTNERLARQVRELVFSLGVKASVTETQAKLYGKPCGTHYRVNFFKKDACRLPRKAVLCRDAKKYTRRFITIEPAGHADVACIRVASPNHLFLCGRSLLPTHNTTDISHHFPAFYLSRYPQYPIIGATHTDKFAEQNGRRVRNIVLSDEHKALFPDITVKDDSSAAARWELTNGGTYMGFGVGATVVGRRAGGIILDDVVAGIASADSETEREAIWNWWGADLSTRLVPGGWVCLVMTRYHVDDIAGRLLAAQSGKYGTKWEVISLPALAKENDILGRKPGEALWPEWQDRNELLRIQNQPSMQGRMWSALYQQEPIIEGGNLVRRDWIKLWKSTEPPECNFILQSWDTAVSSRKDAAYSSCLTWGIFEDEKGPAAVLLSRWRGKLEYNDLKPMAMRLAHNFHDDRWDMPMHSPSRMPPDTILVEEVTAGAPLISDLRRAGIQVTGFKSQKYGDKETRMRLCLDLFSDGRIYVPGQPPHYTAPRRWAGEWLESMMMFPSSKDSLDDADATSQALIHLKTRGWVRTTYDEKPPEPRWRDTEPRGSIY